MNVLTRPDMTTGPDTRQDLAEMLVMSDIHALGPHLDINHVLALWAAHPARHVVLAGDILDLYFAGRYPALVGVDDAARLVQAMLAHLRQGGLLTLIPGNHDPEWLHMLESGTDPAPWQRVPADLRPLLEGLRPFHQAGTLRVQHLLDVGDTVIVHGHQGLHGDWLWRAGAVFDALRGQRELEPMSERMADTRQLAVILSLFYVRMALWARWCGYKQVIHGHIHHPITVDMWGVRLHGLPAWAEGQGHGGGRLLEKPGGDWVKLKSFAD